MNKFSGKLVGKLSSMCDRQRANFLDKEFSQIDKQKHQYLKRKIIKNVSRHFTESTGDSILYKKMLKLNCKKKKIHIKTTLKLDFSTNKFGDYKKCDHALVTEGLGKLVTKSLNSYNCLEGHVAVNSQ